MTMEILLGRRAEAVHHLDISFDEGRAVVVQDQS